MSRLYTSGSIAEQSLCGIQHWNVTYIILINFLCSNFYMSLTYQVGSIGNASDFYCVWGGWGGGGVQFQFRPVHLLSWLKLLFSSWQVLGLYPKLGHVHFSIKLAPRRRAFEELLGPYESGNTMQLTETTDLLRFSQESATFPCSEPDKSNLRCLAMSPEDPFMYYAHCTGRSSKWSFSFRFSNPNPVCASFFSRMRAICPTHASFHVATKSLFTYHPTIRYCIVWITELVVK